MACLPNLILKAKDLKQFAHDIYDFRNFVIDQWQLEELAKAAQKAGIYFYAEGISKDQQTDLFVEPLDTPQAGVERVLEKHGSDAPIVAIPDGPYILAKLEPEELKS